MRFALVGCGHVADMYVRTLPNHAQLHLTGAFDRDPDRCCRFASHHKLHAYASIDEVLSDSSVQLIANLTSPRSHYAVSKAALEAGKHVYSEKPLATTFREAQELVDIAERRGLLLASAPCNLLGETAQTVWKALREGSIGTPRLAYAELDENFLFRDYRNWISESGCVWPFQDEFGMGCTLQHAGYYLGWLTALFGPAKKIVSSAGVRPESIDAIAGDYAPAFAVACIHFASGPVARLTCSSYTSSDNRLRIFGDKGILSAPDCWNYGSPVYIESRVPVSWRERHPRRAELLGLRRRVPLVRRSVFTHSRRAVRMDFCRGIAELGDAVAEHREPRLSARWSLHVTELALAMAAGEGTHPEISSSFEPLAPMSWAA